MSHLAIVERHVWGSRFVYNKLHLFILLVAPFHQQALRLPIVNLQNCRNVYGSTLPITEQQLCAGGQLRNDACSGFGGAPLLVRNADIYYQVTWSIWECGNRLLRIYVHYFICRLVFCPLDQTSAVPQEFQASILMLRNILNGSVIIRPLATITTNRSAQY